MRGAWWTAVAVAAAVTFAAPGTVTAQVAYLGGFAGIVVAAWLGVRRESRGRRLPWALIAACMTSWLLGDVVWIGIHLAGGTSDVGVPDLFWFGGYPLMGLGHYAMVRRRAPRQWRAGLQDGLTLTTAAAIPAWQFLAKPAMVQVPPLVAVAGALYPFGDLVLLGSVLLLVLSPGRSAAPTRLLVAGVASTLLVDIGFTVLPMIWSDVAAERLDGLLLVANAMIVAAVRHPRRDELVTPVHVAIDGLHPARVLFLGLALLTAPAMVVGRGALAIDEQIVVACGCLVTVGFTLTRFTGAVREQSRMQRLLAHLADHDALTGLPNRRMLTDRLDREFCPTAETVILYLDLDGFKAVNDDHGHAAGDAVLVEVARRVRASIRHDDLPVRLGGDEFAVLCPNLSADDGWTLAQRLVAAVAEPVPFGGHLLRVGASVGMSTGSGCGTGDEMIARADTAMLDAKRSGRGRAVAV